MSTRKDRIHKPVLRGLKSSLVWLLKLRIWIAEKLQPAAWQSTLVWAAAAGVGGALGSLAFKFATEGIHQLLTGSREGAVESFRLMPWWARLTVPAVGGVLAGLILLLGKRLLPGQSSTDYMEAIVIGTGRVPVRTSLVKIGAAVFSIGSGGSIGREGPMVQLAAVLASQIGRWRRFTPPELRVLVACGAAAGITSAYNAPIAGAFFVAEIILGSFAMESLGPLIAASVAASLTMRALATVHTLYEVPKFTLNSAWEMGPYLLLGVVAGTMAPWFLRSLRWAEAAFTASRWPQAVRLGVGGLIVGALAIQVPEVCGNGYSVVLSILNGKIPLAALALIMLSKWIATSASFGSGAPGGAFTPSVFMGASVGYLFGEALQLLVPALGTNPQAFALVGMGAFLSAVTHAPVMAVIMLFEMTLSYDIILPLMACSVVAYYVAKGLEGQSLYNEKMERKKVEVPVEDVAAVNVGQLMKADPPRVPSNARFAQIAELFLTIRVNHIYVVDDEGRFAGVVSLHDIKPYLNEPELANLVLAADILRDTIPTVNPEQPLDAALGCFLKVEAERLPVVSVDRVLIGSLGKTDLMLALNERLKRKAGGLDRARGAAV